MLRYGVTATRDRKRVSPLSPLVSIVPAVPPGRPLALRPAVFEGHVCLEWESPAAMLDGSTPVRVGAYAVYRRAERDEWYEEPVGSSRRRRRLRTIRRAPTPGTFTPSAAPSRRSSRSFSALRPRRRTPTRATSFPRRRRAASWSSPRRRARGSRGRRSSPGPRCVSRLPEGRRGRRLDAGRRRSEGPGVLRRHPPRAFRYGVSAVDGRGNESPLAEEAR